MWIQPLFTIIPLNSQIIPQIGKFGLIFDTRPCEIDDIAVSSRPPPSHSPLPLSIHVPMLPQNAIVESTRRLPKGQRHERMEKDGHRKQIEKRDGEYKCVYPCEGQWEDDDHLEGLGERQPGMARWRWSWGIGDLYLEQMRKHEEKERREKVEEGEPKDGDQQ